MVQEEATKLSKRAKRRAASEGADEVTEGGASSPAEHGVDAADEEAADEEAADEDGARAEEGESAAAGASAAAAPNRQARRTAAAQARARRKRERAEAAAIGLDAGEMVDDALVRFTDKVARLAKRHWNTIQWVIGLGIIGWFGYEALSWWRSDEAARLSDALFAARELEKGRIGDPEEQGKPNVNGIIDPTPIFETHDERLEAAAAAYARAAELEPGSTPSSFARLGHAGVQLALGQLDPAQSSLEALAADQSQTPELRGSALQSLGLTLETKNDLPGALRAFEQLAGIASFERRALYQQARIKHRMGDIEAAKALLNKLFEQLGPPPLASLGGLPDRPDFLRERALQLAGVVDPLEKDVKIPKPPVGADAMQQLLQQLESSGAVPPPQPGSE